MRYVLSAILTTTLLTSVSAFAQLESPTAQQTSLEKLESEFGGLSVDSELAEADTLAYDEITSTAKAEEEGMRSDIRRLERESKTLKSAAARAKNRAELAQKRLALQKKIHADNNRKTALAQRQKDAADRRYNQLANQVNAAEAKAVNSLKVNRELKLAIRDTERENAELSRRLKRAQSIIAQEQKRRRDLQAKRARAEQQNRRMKADSRQSARIAGLDS